MRALMRIMGGVSIAVIVHLLHITHLTRAAQRHAPDVLHEICQFDSLVAECGDNEVIIMTHALYGRMKLGLCIQASLGYLGCAADVLSLAERECSGRRTCQLSANRDFKERQTCLKELRSYLQVSYTCRKVTSIDQSECSSCNHVTLTEPRGIIASQQSVDSRCGSPSCPWLITMPTGQRLNLTLVYFDWQRHKQDIYNGAVHSGQSCNDVVATVKETTNQRSYTICPGSQRDSHVYTSLSNTIELRIMGGMQNKDAHQFLIKYAAIGCRDPMIPAGGYIMRRGDTATVGCNNTGASWTLTCADGHWSRDAGTCQEESTEPVIGYVKVGNLTLSFGVSVTVIILLAVLISALVLCVGMIVVRRRCHHAPENENVYAVPPYMDGSSYKDPPPPYQTGNTPRKLQRVSNDKGYAHIWERPLPDKPENASTAYESSYAQEPGSLHYGYSTIASVPRPNENRRGHMPGHSQGQTYGNNTLARQDILLSDNDEIEYPRYFQTRSDGNIKQSGESSHLTA